MFRKILFLILLCSPLFPDSTQLNSGWEILTQKYQKKEGVPPQVKNPESSSWDSITPKEIFHISKSKEYKLIRIPIKVVSFLDPIIYIDKGVFSFRLFLDNKEIYKFSDHTQFYSSSFLGWIWHEIPIKKKNYNTFLYLEIYSEIDLPFPIPRIYERKEFYEEIIRNNLISFFISAFAILLGFYLLINYFFKLNEYFYLALSLFYILLGIWLINVHIFSQFIFPTTPFRLQVEYLSMYLAPIFALWFLELSFPSRANIISKYIRYIYFFYALIFGILDFLKIFPLWKTLIPYDLILLVGLLFYIYRVVREIIRGKTEAKILSIGIIILIFSVLHDVLVVTGIISNIMIMPFGTFAFIISKSGIALYKISMMHRSIRLYSVELESKNNQLDEWNHGLELKVLERTKEVTEKMNEIHALKVHQDGDYFLTSLVVNPLTKIENQLKSIKVEHFSKQKKQFEFRNRKSELGGDIIISQNLRFQQYKNEFLFFCNADAMGKSMQGATGAIVAGTVINNLLSRATQLNKPISKTPTNWLKEMYLEMDNLFRTFNGSMLLSAICGLIEEKTGKLYYFNAEHPNLVLYRDNKANVIELKSEIRKLGMEIDQKFFVENFHLKKGDILFCGSDGKDDIEIDGIIHSDEERFLNCVEKGKGDLEKIIKEIQNQGKIIDDQSLLKIKIS